MELAVHGHSRYAPPTQCVPSGPCESFEKAGRFISGHGWILSERTYFGSPQIQLLFDLIQFVIRLPITANLPQFPKVQRIFRANMLAYDLLDILPYGPAIIPTASREEGEIVRKAFVQLRGPFDGARTHLLQSAEYLNAGDAAKAVSEAAHSIDSLVRVISPNKSFNQALAALDTGAKIHPVFEEALIKLSDYSSDERGIRHPRLESTTSNVGIAEAVFMFGAWASFATYLIARARAARLLNAQAVSVGVNTTLIRLPLRV